MRAATAAGVALLLGGCAVAGSPACPPGAEAATVAEAFFGRHTDGRLAVTDPEWARFLDEEVTPRFPDGLTVLDAAGQWRGRDGRVAREPAKLLLLVLPNTDTADARRRLLPVTDAYKRRFRQQSVLMSLRAGCADF